ncbi:hypothetical protein [Occallatibacter savannae]|uniref:hypothetical protein n=1 Tax=Occallatibacter savannae TaxID=1002691 RepID=UPI000D68A514|nr:hypothetical protein [Occallatibacter savannae]
MTVRGIIWSVLLAVSAVISAGVSLYGVWSAMSIDLRQDTALSVVYCAMPILCLPVLLILRPLSRSTFVLSLMALTFVGAYSVLNWRTCSELGYCESVIATVMQTINADATLAYFAVVILNLVALLVDDKVGVWGYKS